MAALKDNYYSMTADGRLVVFDYRQYLGEQLYAALRASMDEIREWQKEAGYWHEAMTPERVTGMIMAAGYTLEELTEMVSDEGRRGDVAVEAFDAILEAAKGGAKFPAMTAQHPTQKMPVWNTLSPEATKAILTMRPLF
jgi:hypothetical protein